MSVRHWTLLAILSVLWGGTFFFVAIALREVPPLTLVFARCLIAAVVLVPSLVALGYAFPVTVTGWRDFMVMAVLNNVIPFALIFYAQKTVPAGLAAVLNATTPLMSLIVLRIVAGEVMSANKIAGVVTGLLGVAVLVGVDNLSGAAAGPILGPLAILAATLSYGFSGLWGRRLQIFAAPISAASQMICSTLLMLPLAVGVDGLWSRPWPSTTVLAAVLALGILSTAVAYVLFFEIMRSAGPLNVMLVTLLVPFTAIALGAAYLGEALTVRQSTGALIIGVSLLVIDGRLFGIKPLPPRGS